MSRLYASVIETVAIALYDTDEDITDEAMALRGAKLERSWSEIRSPRLDWALMQPTVKDAYRRRAMAALSALTYDIPEGSSVEFAIGAELVRVTKI